jgi:hypothetical protein
VAGVVVEGLDAVEDFDAVEDLDVVAGLDAVGNFDVEDFDLAVDFVATGTPRRPAPRDAWVAPRRLAAEDGSRVFFVLDL